MGMRSLQFFKAERSHMCNKSMIVRMLHAAGFSEDSKLADVAIVGAGMVGAAVACGIASHPLLKDLKTVVLDGKPLGPTIADVVAKGSDIPDARVVAISPATVRFLEEVGVWSEVKKCRVTPFSKMQVWDHVGKGFVKYSAAEVEREELGYIVENHVLTAALQDKIRATSSIQVLAPASLASIHWPRGSQTHPPAPAATEGHDWPHLSLTDDRELRARLLIGADGARSFVRSSAAIPTVGWSYPQTAVISTVRLAPPPPLSSSSSSSSSSTAFQVFLPTGPLALLPCGPHLANVVWSTSAQHAQALKEMEGADFVKEVNAALHGHVPSSNHGPPLGGVSQLLPPSLWAPLASSLAGSGGAFQRPPIVSANHGPRFSFPLQLRHADAYVAPRLALVGDAAHAVHPLAGQGVNLGFGDAASLVATLGNGAAAGRDLGELSLLEEYETSQKRTNLAMMVALDGLQKLFSVEWRPFGLGRNLGLDLVRVSGPVKKQIMSFAMGL